MLPSVIAALSALHQLWDPSVRFSISFEQIPTGFSLQRSHYLTSPAMLASLYDMRIGGLGHAVASKQSSRCLADLEEYRNSTGATDPPHHECTLGAVLYHLRYQLYQLIGLAAAQKALYVHPNHDDLCTVLQTTFSFVDNKHMAQLLKYFMEPYLMNATPFILDRIAPFVGTIMASTLERLSICWSSLDEADPSTSSIHGALSSAASESERIYLMQRYVYKLCGMEWNAGCGITLEEMDSKRSLIISNVTKHYADTLLSVLCCRGFMATPLAELKASKAKKNEGVEERVGGGMLGDHFDEDGGEKVDDEEILQARRLSLLRLVIDCDAVRPNFLGSAIALLSIPDSTCAKKGLLLLETLAPMAGAHSELLVPIGREAFQTLLGVLFRQESWSKGMEWDCLGMIEVIYTLFVPESVSTEENGMSQYPRIPREILLSLGVPPGLIEGLEARLRELKNKKKRRDALRDFLMEVSAGLGGADLDKSVGAKAGATRTMIDVNLGPLHARIGQNALVRRHQSAMATEALLVNEVIGNLFKDR